MNKLSTRTKQRIASDYRRAYGVRVRFISGDGAVEGERLPEWDRLVVVRQARAHGLAEAVRWGEPYTFFVSPGVLSWVVPVVDGFDVCGGVVGGEVLSDSGGDDWEDAMTHLIRHGAAPDVARTHLSSRPVWPQARCRSAAEYLFALVYQVSGFRPSLLTEQRERSQQQRHIAEEIHRRKAEGDRPQPMADEHILLSLIRAGDQKGARRILNQLLGRVFLRSANLTVIRALMIEMMGYLVRRAVEDSPFLAPIMEKNHQWMARIIEAEDFETLATVLRLALDDFMRHVYEMGYAAGNRHVDVALRYLQAHYREPVALEDVADATGLSTYRIAHLIKEQTGQSIIQHVHRLRMQEAQRLLEDRERAVADIALDLGFCDQSYFTRQFKKYVGVTPARYRRMDSGSATRRRGGQYERLEHPLRGKRKKSL